MRVAVLQYTAGGNAADTLRVITALTEEAAAGGAELVSLPECASFIAPDRQTLFEIAEDSTDSPTLNQLRTLAAQHHITLHIGSLLMRSRGAEKCVNRGFLISPTGEILTHYDKIHMFTADVGDGKRYREAEQFAPGNRPVLCDTDCGRIGMSICYDVRFASLYHYLASEGAQIIMIPAAFTEVTGRAHWHVLLRTRAIETGCFVLAAAQTGTHADGRKTYGHALIINPWGEVLCDAGTTPQTALIVDIDLAEGEQARRRIPSLSHPAIDFS